MMIDNDLIDTIIKLCQKTVHFDVIKEAVNAEDSDLLTHIEWCISNNYISRKPNDANYFFISPENIAFTLKESFSEKSEQKQKDDKKRRAFYNAGVRSSWISLLSSLIALASLTLLFLNNYNQNKEDKLEIKIILEDKSNSQIDVKVDTIIKATNNRENKD